MAHPVNWGIVWVVVFMAAFAWREIHHGTKSDCGCNG
jgi:hypothetical protein